MAVSLIDIAYLGVFIILAQHVSCLEPIGPSGRHDSLVSSLAPSNSGLRAEGLHSSSVQDLLNHLLPSSGTKSVDQALGHDAAPIFLPIRSHSTNAFLPTGINTIHRSIGPHSITRQNRGHILHPTGGSIGHLTSTVRRNPQIGILDLKELVRSRNGLQGGNRDLFRKRAHKELLGLTKQRRNLRTRKRNTSSLLQKYKLLKKRQMLAKKKKLLRKLSKLRRRKNLLNRYRKLKSSRTHRRLSGRSKPNYSEITHHLRERSHQGPLILFEDPVPQL